MENKIKTTPKTTTPKEHKDRKLPWYAGIEVKDLVQPITLRRIWLLQGTIVLLLLATAGYMSWKYFYTPLSGKQLVDQMVAAAGTMEVWNNIQNGQFTRTHRQFSESGEESKKRTETFYFKKTNSGLKMMVKSVTPKGEEVWVSKDKDGYWASKDKKAVDPVLTARDQGMMCESKWCEPLCASSMAFYRFSMPFKLMDNGVIPKNAGDVQLGGQQMTMLDVSYDPKVGRDRWVFYVDPKDKLIRKLEYHHTTDKGDSHPEEIYWSDHSNDSGIVFSHKWTRYFSNGKVMEEFIFSDTDFKTEIAENFFDRPKGSEWLTHK